MPDQESNDDIMYRFAAVVETADQATLLNYIEDNFADLTKQDGDVISGIAELVLKAQPTEPGAPRQIASLALSIIPLLLERWKLHHAMAPLVAKAWRVFPEPSNAAKVIEAADLCLTRIDRETLYYTGETNTRDWMAFALLSVPVYRVRRIREAAERAMTASAASQRPNQTKAAKTLKASIWRRLNRKPDA